MRWSCCIGELLPARLQAESVRGPLFQRSAIFAISMVQACMAVLPQRRQATFTPTGRPVPIGSRRRATSSFRYGSADLHHRGIGHECRGTPVQGSQRKAGPHCEAPLYKEARRQRSRLVHSDAQTPPCYSPITSEHPCRYGLVSEINSRAVDISCPCQALDWAVSKDGMG